MGPAPLVRTRRRRGRRAGLADRYLVYFSQSIIEATLVEGSAQDGIVVAGSYVLGMSPNLRPEVAEPQQLAVTDRAAHDAKR
jgi:hypothetical protein